MWERYCHRYQTITFDFIRIVQKRKKPTLLLLFSLFGFVELFVLPMSVHAVATTAFMRTDRMGATVATGGTVCMTPQTTNTEGKVLVTFPGNGTQSATSYGVNSTFGNWTVSTSNLPTGSTAWVGIGTATAVSGATVTFASGDLVVGTQYCFNFTGTSTLTLPTGANTNNTGTIQTQTSGAAAIDTVNYATSNIASNGDQIIVTATVPSTYSMTLSGTAAALGSLPTSGAPNTANVTMTVSTNANNGWLAWAKDANANSTLTSVTTSDTSISSGAYTTGAGNIHSLSGAAGYGMSVATGTGSPTIATEYAGSSTSFGSLDNAKFEQFASKSVPASANTVTITFGAEAAATTKAATDYTDTVTITSAGQF